MLFVKYCEMLYDLFYVVCLCVLVRFVCDALRGVVGGVRVIVYGYFV